MRNLLAAVKRRIQGPPHRWSPGGTVSQEASSREISNARSGYSKLPTSAPLTSWASRTAVGFEGPDPVRELFLTRLGRTPERSSTDLTILQVRNCDGYEIRSVSVMLETNRSIPVHILVPDEPGPHATLLALHGHGGDYLNGKSKVTAINGTRSGRGYGIELVLAGYVVVVPDLLGFGERDYVDQVRNGPWNQDIERFLYSAATIKGATLAGLNMFDMSHVIDAVLTLPEIDSGRLGVIGHSMGGTLAPMLMMYDGRLGVGVSSCGVSTWKAMLEAHVIHNYAVYAPDLGDGTDFDDLVAALAPRPFFMIAGESDPNTPVDGVKVVQDIATASYRRQHAEIAFQTRIRPGGHAFFPDDREAAARFLATHLPTGARSQ